MNKSILFLLSGLQIGGAEKQTVKLANNLCEKYKITLCYLGQSSQLVSSINSMVEVIPLNKKNFLDVKAFLMLLRVINERKPSIVFVINPFPMMYGFAARFFIREKPKLILGFRYTYTYSLKDKVKNLFYKRIMNKMDKIVFVCKMQKEYWVSKYNIKPEISTVIYNGVDINKFKTGNINIPDVKRSLRIMDDEIVICLIASFHPVKKHEDMIDACHTLMKQGYKIKVFFVGDGVRRKHIEKHIEKRDLNKNVILTGYVSDVAPYLAVSDISVLTSVAETFSNAILESMAMGKPIIMTDIGGARELIIDGEDGYVYKAGDVDALVNKIKEIINNNSFQKLGNNSLKRVSTFFSYSITIDKYTELFEEVLSCRQAGMDKVGNSI